jgi:hypothetical protein
MIITSKMSLPLTVFKAEKDGRESKKTIRLCPGKRSYPQVDHKDPRVAEQLRVMRKHGRISFDELLASDVELLKNMKGTPEEKAAALKAATSTKPPQPIVKVSAPKNPKSAESSSRATVAE